MRYKLLAPRPRRVYAVVMDEGDEVASCLDVFARHTGVDGGAFTAIGAVSSATLGFFDPDVSDYRPIPVTQQAEVVSLVGDITRSGDGGDDGMEGRTVHGHMVVAVGDGSTVGGHLLKATVRPTLELIVTEQPAHLRRRHDPKTGLALIDLDSSEGLGAVAVAGESGGADRP